MKKFLALAALITVTSAAYANTKAHEECLKAVDYKGCLDARTAVKKPIVNTTNNYFTEKLPPNLFELLLDKDMNDNSTRLADSILLTNKCLEALPDKLSEIKGTICSYFRGENNELGKPINTVDSLNKRLQKAIDEWADLEILADTAEYNAKIEPVDTYFDLFTPQGKLKYTSSCPPGKSLRQKTTFLGLIKLGKVCLSDYEVESLNQRERHRALDNFNDSMDSLVESMKPPRSIYCNSTSNGTYTSTSCY